MPGHGFMWMESLNLNVAPSPACIHLGCFLGILQ
jgi:hypothetical protein